MTVRQYIGARYVPRFRGEWDNTTQYDALDVVDNGSGTSYIARKTVPAGTPLTNTEYWFIYGTSSGAILDLQNRVDNIEDEIDDIKKDNRYFIFQGDSYSLTSFYSFDTWGELLPQYLGLSVNDYTLLENDGAGFTDPGGQTNQTFIQQLVANPVSKDVTDVFVAGGANDRNSSAATIKAAIASYAAKVKEMYPNAKLHIAMPSWSYTDAYANAIWSNAYNGYRDGAIEAGAHWIGSPSYALVLGSDFEDYLHPNATGQQIISHAMANGLNNGEYDINVKKSLTLTPVFNGTFDDTGVTYEQHNEVINVRFTGAPKLFTFTAATNVGRSFAEFATLSDSINVGGYLYGSCTAIFEDSSHNLTEMPTMFRILGNKVYIGIAYSVSNIIKIYIPEFAFPGICRS